VILPPLVFPDRGVAWRLVVGGNKSHSAVNPEIDDQKNPRTILIPILIDSLCLRKDYLSNILWCLLQWSLRHFQRLPEKWEPLLVKCINSMMTFSGWDIFIFDRKEWGVTRREGEREWEREICGAYMKKGCGMGHKLDQWSSICEGLKDGFYQDER
jgi:hypothetical protein